MRTLHHYIAMAAFAAFNPSCRDSRPPDAQVPADPIADDRFLNPRGATPEFLRKRKPSEGVDEGAASIDEAREAYFSERGWSADHPLLTRLGSANAYFQFYSDALVSEDENIRRLAFEFFFDVTRHPHFGPVPFSYTTDLPKLSVYAVFHGTYAGAASDIAVLGGQSGWLELIERIIPFLDNSDIRDKALGILNGATAQLYNDKPVDWWRTKFGNSQFAGLLQGLPLEEWSARPDGALVPLIDADDKSEPQG